MREKAPLYEYIHTSDKDNDNDIYNDNDMSMAIFFYSGLCGACRSS